MYVLVIWDTIKMYANKYRQVSAYVCMTGVASKRVMRKMEGYFKDEIYGKCTKR